jgi:hypothetical protein
MNNWKIIFAIMIIFGAGVGTGGLVVNDAHSHLKNNVRPHAAPAEGRSASTRMLPHAGDVGKPPRPPEVLSPRFLQLLDGQLHLATDEREAIQRVMNEDQNQIRKTLQDARLEIREVLTPGQRRKFDELVKRPFRKPIFGTNALVVAPPATNL